MTASDRTLKKDITPIVGGLAKILSLHGYDFSWKADGRKDMGIIAQEVEQVFPNIVHTNAQGIKSVEYSNLVAPMIEAMREQQATIDHQQQEINLLKTSLEKIEVSLKK